MEFLVGVAICGLGIIISFAITGFIEKYYIKEYLRDKNAVEQTYKQALGICSNIKEKDNFDDMVADLTLCLLNYQGLQYKCSDIKEIIEGKKPSENSAI